MAEREIILRGLAKQIRAQRYPGGCGLMLWANAAVRAVSPVALLGEAGLDGVTLERRIIPALTTMEVAWLVSGLLHTDNTTLHSVRDAALRELVSRLVPETHVFLHASDGASWRHRLRGRTANFADQIYPVQALAFMAIALADRNARELAERCAKRLVATQGPLGQWWWHHDALTGCIAERYPVYSVHQHSMAPMALHSLAIAGGRSHTEAIGLSRAWLGTNELGLDLIERSSGVIWRSIERDETSGRRWMWYARIVAGLPAAEDVPPRLRLNREMRPYEWGWLLYATAIEAERARPSHIV
jgi:hypothetical protein